MSYRFQKLYEEKVFKDPVHRYIHVRDQVIWDLIGTKEFQRLRRIKQLGTTYLTFHGAEHSRFTHSLGVYEIIRRMVDDVFSGRPEWNDDDRLLALCAGLLHDVGHGPFSHTFEKIFNLDHEELTREIIEGSTEINEILRKVGEDFPKQVSEVIEKTSANKLVTSMISSQIDADRMDYLLRDAYYTGVSYGNFDMERILRIMRPRPDGVVIKQSGMHAVEHYLISRFQMYWQVYFHPVSRSAEAILQKILQRAKYLHETGYHFNYVPVHFGHLFEGKVDLDEYIKLDESVLLYYFQVWQEESDQILSDLCQRFLNRKLFQYVDFDTQKHTEKFAVLKELFLEIEIDPEYYLVIDTISDEAYDYFRYGEEGGKKPILLLQTNGDLKEISRKSELVDGITGKKLFDSKLYFPHDLIYNDPDEKKKKVIEMIEEIAGAKRR
ncbi:HD domain-containing protein [Gottfriedia sp. NPDC057948]|uniref:HD domain-containing protein n=1 Tax=Gottfriedia sp. NPDC057948 TaxID=3346287 RepID=UPI0036DA6AF8